MTISVVSVLNTFLEWMTRTNQIIVEINKWTEGEAVSTGNVTITNVSGGPGTVALNVANGHVKANVDGVWDIPGANLKIGSVRNHALGNNGIQIIVATGLEGSGSVNLGSSITITPQLSLSVANISQTALAVANTVNTVHDIALTANGTAIYGAEQANLLNTFTKTIFTATNVAYSAANTASDRANTARGDANAAFNQANTAYNRANVAYDHANAAYAQANSANITAQGAFLQANTACTQSNQAGTNANNAYGQANSAIVTASAAFAKGNLACTQSDTAGTVANSASSSAGAAFGKANTACTQSDQAGTNANNAYAKANAANVLASNATIVFDFDGSGSVPDFGRKGTVVLPWSGMIRSWTIVGSPAGNCKIDLWRSANPGQGFPSPANTLTSNAGITVLGNAANTKNSGNIFTSNTFTTGDLLTCNLMAANAMTKITLSVHVLKT
jgi:hypothetical protein